MDYGVIRRDLFFLFFFFSFSHYILFFGWNIYSCSLLCFAFILENHLSLDSWVFLRSTFFLLSTCLRFCAIDYAASLKIVPLTKTTSSDIFHIAAYCIEYIDNFVYSGQQLERPHKRKTRTYPRPKVTCSIVVVVVIIIIINLNIYIH